MKYIDADLLREKITEQMESLPREVGRDAGTITSTGYGMMQAFQIMRSIIDSLQQEHNKFDLEKEIETSIRLLNGLHTFEDNKNWYKGRYEELKKFANHFYELGRFNARKEE